MSAHKKEESSREPIVDKASNALASKLKATPPRLSKKKKENSEGQSSTATSEPERELKPQKVSSGITLNGMNMWLMCACAKKNFNASGLFRPNSGSRRQSQGGTSPSRKIEPITRHDSDETTSWDDDEKPKKEKGKVKKDEEGSDKMAKDHGSDKSTSEDDGKKTKKEKGKVRMDEEGSDKKRDVMGEERNDMKEQKMVDEDGKGKQQKVKDKKRKRKRTEEEIMPNKFRPGTFQPFKTL